MFHRITGSHNERHTADPANSELKVKELREALGPLTGRSLKYCTDACLRRYLEARNWNVGKAKIMLEESLEWRAAYRPEDLRWASHRTHSAFYRLARKVKTVSFISPFFLYQCDVSKEAETGKLFRADFHDRHGRTVLIMTPGKQNLTAMDDHLKLVVYSFENAIFHLPEGQEQMVWLIDFTGWSLYCVPLKASKDFMNTLQNHYPERLAMCFLYNPPRIFHTTFKIAKYFMDAKTFEKIKFVYPKDEESVELMKTYFDAKNLPAEFGGEATLKYDHEEYSRQMAEDDVKLAAYWALET